MYYNQDEDQMFIPKKKPYNEACDIGHDMDQVEEALRAEAAREAEARARAEEAIARAEEARARAAEAKAEAIRLAAKAKCKKRHKKEKEHDCKRKHKKKK